jgi:XTP/dITP diphosphohydrolase
VNDSGWYFSGLNGFPGSFMKYINNWFTAENFLDLTRNLSNREVILKQVVVYIDGNHIKVLGHQIKGVLLNEARGHSPRVSDNIIAMSESGLSFGEQNEQDDFKLETEEKLWEELALHLKSIH